MRNAKELDTEIRKLRLVLHNQKFPERAKENAWAMMLALQWVKTTRKSCSLTPMELSGITMDQAQAVKKMVNRQPE